MGKKGTAMKWMLVIMVFGTTPVKTELIFQSLSECLKAEDQMKAEYVTAYNIWDKWARENTQESGYPKSKEYQMKRIGLYNPGTCIPHKG
jgi:hypothetical protein